MEKFTNTSLKNIAWFNDINKSGKLDMTPSYQRNAVWTERQKSFLIDSILNGFPIPEIYIKEEIDENGDSKHIIVDGQQRLRAVLEYLNDSYGINIQDSPMFNGAKFSELTPDQKRTFFKYPFIVRIIPDISDEEIREIFKRLNKNVVSLNEQELRKAAYSGDFIKLISKLSENDFWSKLRIFTANDVKRMMDEQYISELAIASLEGITNKKDRLEKFYEETEVSFPQQAEVQHTFDHLFTILSPIADILSKTRWRNKTDFYTLFLSICHFRDILLKNVEKINVVGQQLTNFSNQVYECLKVIESVDTKYPQYIIDYTKGIRAATDYSARNMRQESLDIFINRVVSQLLLDGEDVETR